MVRISEEKINKIKSNILSLLYHEFPKSLFTAQIAKSEARDEEFIKKLMFDLKEKKLVILVDKNSKGKNFKKRQRWRLSNQAYEAYKKHQ